METQNINLSKQVGKLLEQQTQDWELAAKNYAGLKKALKRSLDLGNGEIVDVQFNPERIYSSSARVDAKSVRERKCFLCPENLPQQQEKIEFGNGYSVLVNPFPIFRQHLTIPVSDHVPQSILGRMNDMLELAKALPGYVVFYNGPRCGASAPDHFHFQAGNKGFMRIENDMKRLPSGIVKEINHVTIMALKRYHRPCIVLQSNHLNDTAEVFNRIFEILSQHKDEEPMVNILTMYDKDTWHVFIYPRKLHRPKQYFLEGEDQILLSPASVDFGGVLITPRKEDYSRLDAETVIDIFNQISIDKEDFDELVRKIKYL